MDMIREINIKIIGPRPGETFHEELMTEREILRAYKNGSLYAILPEETTIRDPDVPSGFTETNGITRSSENAEKLSTDEIISLLGADKPMVHINE